MGARNGQGVRVTPKPVTLDPRAPVKAIRLLAGRPYEKLAAACGYATGGSLTRAEGRGGAVDVSTVRRVAAGAGVRLDARARRGAGPWAELVLATLGDAPISVEALYATAAWLGVDLELRATREEPGTPLADAALDALATRAEEAGKAVTAHLVREVAAEGRAKRGRKA